MNGQWIQVVGRLSFLEIYCKKSSAVLAALAQNNKICETLINSGKIIIALLSIRHETQVA